MSLNSLSNFHGYRRIVFISLTVVMSMDLISLFIIDLIHLCSSIEQMTRVYASLQWFTRDKSNRSWSFSMLIINSVKNKSYLDLASISHRCSRWSQHAHNYSYIIRYFFLVGSHSTMLIIWWSYVSTSSLLICVCLHVSIWIDIDEWFTVDV
jgi:hypothetical protein